MAGVPGMHKRSTTSPTHAKALVDRIQSSLLVNRLQKHALADTEVMTMSQITAARVLLGKCLPDLSSVDSRVTGNVIVNIVD